MNQQSFDDIIKQKANAYEAPVPADAWGNIVKEKKKKRRILFFWLLPGLLLLGGTGAAVWYNYNHGGSTVASAHVTEPGKKEILPEKRTVPPAAIKTVDKNGDSRNMPVISDKRNTVAHSGNEQISSAPNYPDTGEEQNAAGRTDKKENRRDGPAIQRKTVQDKNLVRQHDPVAEKKNDTPVSSLSVLTPAIKTTGDGIPLINDAATKTGEQPYAAAGDFSPAAEPLADTVMVNDSFAAAISIDMKSPVAVDTAAVPVKRIVKRSGWILDAAITPFVSLERNMPVFYVQRTVAGNLSEKVFIADQVHTTAQPALAYTLAARKQLRNKIGIGFGIQYARIMEKVKLSGTETHIDYSVVKRLENGAGGPLLVDDTLVSVTSGHKVVNATNSYSTLSIPLFFQYPLVSRRTFSLRLNAGTYINLNRRYTNTIAGDLKTIYGGQQPGRSTNTSVDVFAGLRFSVPAGRHYTFFAEPGFRYALLKSNTASMINAKYLHQAGLSIGVSWSLPGR